MKEYETEWTQMSPHVWILAAHPDPERMQPALGVIITRTQTVLIDAGNGPEHAQVVLDWLKERKAPPISYVILTHHHWDHLFGMGLLDGHIVCHERGYEHLERLTSMPWSKSFIEEDLIKHPEKKMGHEGKLRAIQQWEKVQLRMPHITFSDQLCLHIDHLTLKLRHVGGRHADDSVIVKVVEDDLVFVGDCFYPASPSRREEGESLSIEILNKLLEEDAHTYIHGHGRPLKKSSIHKYIARAEKERAQRKSSKREN